jgi:type 2 lantibiotic biosynthesis protein LanM
MLLYSPSAPSHLTDITTIVANASFLWERLDSERFVTEFNQSEQQEIDRRFDRWCNLIAKGNWNTLQNRLQWEGLTLDSVRPKLGTVHLAANQPLPNWAEALQQIIETAALMGNSGAIEFRSASELPLPINPSDPIPFEDILIPFIKVARQKLFTQVGSSHLTETGSLSLLSETAYGALERALLKQLGKLCTKTLDLEFSRSRPFGQNLIQLLGVETDSSPSKTHYTQFVNQLLQDGLLAFFQKYPVLGRLVATAIDFWVESTAEFLDRLARDQADIQQTFGTNSQVELGKVTTIDASLSDSHDQGRTVILLTFASGLKLVYKPKNLGLEVAFNQFLSWCNQESNLLDFKVMQVLDRNHYGWVEYVEHQPCADEAAAKRFYQRAGMLLCVLYVLRGTDCHNENLIAHGEHLVLIDMEALLYPEANPIGDAAAFQDFEATAAQHLSNSVLRTGLLPRWDFSADFRVAYDVSGLGSTNPQQAPQKVPCWQATNTDNMHLRYESVMMPVEKNVPFLGDVALSPNTYQSQIAEGFEQMYRFFMQHKDVLLAPESPLAAMQHQQVRFIFRPTRIYGFILQKALTPDCLRCGVDYSIEIDQLSYVFLISSERPNAWSILNAELRSLEQLDIPLFTASAASDELCIGNDTIPHCFKQSSYQQTLDQLQALNETDLRWQAAIIQGAFYAKIAQTADQKSDNQKSNESTVEPSALLSSEQFLEEVNKIAAELEARAVLDPNGSVNWIGLSYVLEAERFQLQVLNDSLYEGRCGVALFLAALYHVTGESRWRDLSLRALCSLRRSLQTLDSNAQAQPEEFTGIGGAIGLGSMIYSFVKVSQFLNDATLLHDAEALAQLMTPERIAADTHLDIVLGTAGALLGLLSLYEATHNETVLAIANTCGQHLLNHQVSYEGAPKAWLPFGEKPLTGFSHGAAGISYALLRLYEATNDRTYLEAALEGIDYERSAFSEADGNWFDLRQSQPSFLVQWCHGATGIGLARLGSLNVVNTPAIQSEIEVAMHTTQNYGLQKIDHLCCGNLGRVEALLVAADRCDRPDWRQAALENASTIVTKAKQNGSYQLFPNLPSSAFNPGFLQGTAGIGYELLRLAGYDLPSVLLWE